MTIKTYDFPLVKFRHRHQGRPSESRITITFWDHQWVQGQQRAVAAKHWTYR